MPFSSVEPVRTFVSSIPDAPRGWWACLTVILALTLLLQTAPVFAIQHQPGDRETDPPVQVAAADTLEPNDTPQTASPLNWLVNEARSGPADISSGLDLDFYSIELNAGDSLSAGVAVEEAGVNVLSPAVSILDSTGTAIASDLINPGIVSASVSVSGRYLVLVTDRSLLEGNPFSGEPRGYELLLTRHLRRGDVDGSGVLDYRDAFVVFMLAAGLLDPESVEPRVLEAADINGNGMVAGDMDDFRTLISQVEFVPVRDPLSGGKQKITGGTTLADSLAGLWAELTGGPQLPAAAQPSLEQNSPNPLNPSTTISFSLPELTTVNLAVYSTRGRLVRTLAAGEHPAGSYQVHWDGTDSAGRRVASGVYFYRLRAGNTVLTRKLVVLK